MQLNEFHAAIYAWPCFLSDCPSMLWPLVVITGRGVGCRFMIRLGYTVKMEHSKVYMS